MAEEGMLEEEIEEVIIGGLESDLKELRGMTRWAATHIELAKLDLARGDYETLRKRLEELSSVLREAHDKAAYCLDMYRAEVLRAKDMLQEKS